MKTEWWDAERTTRCLVSHPDEVDGALFWLASFKTIKELQKALISFKENYEKNGTEVEGGEGFHPIIHTAIPFRSYLSRLP